LEHQGESKSDLRTTGQAPQPRSTWIPVARLNLILIRHQTIPRFRLEPKAHQLACHKNSLHRQFDFRIIIDSIPVVHAIRNIASRAEPANLKSSFRPEPLFSFTLQPLTPADRHYYMPLEFVLIREIRVKLIVHERLEATFPPLSATIPLETSRYSPFNANSAETAFVSH
jgi:hypothetical protein